MDRLADVLSAFGHVLQFGRRIDLGGSLDGWLF
jgi:hypothetical protein